MRGPALFVLVGTTSKLSLPTREDEKVGLSDRQEPVNVTLCVEDWAVVVTALANSAAPLADKARINDTIFECARLTVRQLI